MFQAVGAVASRSCRVAAYALATLVTLGAFATPALAGSGYNRAVALAYDKQHIDHFLNEESERLDISPFFSLSVKEVDALPNDDLGVADITNRFGDAWHDAEAHCDITISKSAHTGGAADETDAHEAFHCLEAQMAGSLAKYRAEGKWLREGAATWVAADLVRDNVVVQGWWRKYFDTPQRPLFDRSYDAIGFYGHLAADGISPWKLFPAMFDAENEDEAYAASGAPKTPVLTNEASQFFDRGELGKAWTPHHQFSAIATGNVPEVKPMPKRSRSTRARR